MFRRILRRLKKDDDKDKFRTAKIMTLKTPDKPDPNGGSYDTDGDGVDDICDNVRLKLIHYRKTKTEMV